MDFRGLAICCFGMTFPPTTFRETDWWIRSIYSIIIPTGHKFIAALSDFPAGKIEFNRRLVLRDSSFAGTLSFYITTLH